MKYGLVEGQRHEAQPGLSAHCPICDSRLVAKCGEHRVWHWAHHRRTRNCDAWWEPETEWHRAWKNHFPDSWQEVIHRAEDGEKHIADVKTEHGQVIEIQHSYLKPEERRAREAFYGSMVWVVNGLRLASFSKSFDKQLQRAKVLKNTPIRLRLPVGNCTILKTWADSTVSVYMDFGDTTFTDDRFNFSKPILWRLCPVSSASDVELIPIWREVFIAAALNGSSISGIHDPEMTVGGETKVLWKPSKDQRRESESHTAYALRVWKFPGIN